MNISTKYNFINCKSKQQIPPCIYHLTNRTNYESILKDGFIRPKDREFIGEGVFAVELKNLFMRWQNCIFSNKNISALEALIIHVTKGENNLVMLKIPTNKLHKSDLYVRSQNRLHEFVNNPATDIAIYESRMSAYEYSPNSDKKTVNDYCRKMMLDLCKKFNVENAEHCIFGTSALNADIFESNNEALEYIYKAPISSDCFEKVGEANIDEVQFDSENGIKNLFKSMLKGTSEIDEVAFLEC